MGIIKENIKPMSWDTYSKLNERKDMALGSTCG